MVRWEMKKALEYTIRMNDGNGLTFNYQTNLLSIFTLYQLTKSTRVCYQIQTFIDQWRQFIIILELILTLVFWFLMAMKSNTTTMVIEIFAGDDVMKKLCVTVVVMMIITRCTFMFRVLLIIGWLYGVWGEYTDNVRKLMASMICLNR